MIDKLQAKTQILRLGQMLGFPNTREALSELVLEIEKAETREIANEIVSEFLDAATSETRCPMPGEIRSALRRKQKPEGYWASEKPLDPTCKPCLDSGIIGGYGGVRASWCECKSGQERRQNDPLGVAAANEMYDKLETAFKSDRLERIGSLRPARAKADNVIQILKSIDAGRADAGKAGQ